MTLQELIEALEALPQSARTATVDTVSTLGPRYERGVVYLFEEYEGIDNENDDDF